MVTKEQKIRHKFKKVEEALYKLLDNIKTKIDAGEVPSDEEIRFLKKFMPLIQEIDLAKKSSKDIVKKPVPPGRLKDLIDLHMKYGVNADKVMDKAGYYKCKKCSLWHWKEEKCPFPD